MQLNELARQSGNQKLKRLSRYPRPAIVAWRSIALVQSPELITFDEPTRGIDVEVIAEIHQEIKRLADEGRAVVMVLRTGQKYLHCPTVF